MINQTILFAGPPQLGQRLKKIYTQARVQQITIEDADSLQLRSKANLYLKPQDVPRFRLKLGSNPLVQIVVDQPLLPQTALSVLHKQAQRIIKRKIVATEFNLLQTVFKHSCQAQFSCQLAPSQARLRASQAYLKIIQPDAQQQIKPARKLYRQSQFDQVEPQKQILPQLTKNQPSVGELHDNKKSLAIYIASKPEITKNQANHVQSQLKFIQSSEQLHKLPQFQDPAQKIELYISSRQQTGVQSFLANSKCRLRVHPLYDGVQSKRRCQAEMYIVNQKYFIKKKNRTAFPKLRVIFVGRSLPITLLQKSVEERYRDRITTVSLPSSDKLTVGGGPSIFIFDNKQKRNGANFAMRLQDSSNNVFLMSQSPSLDRAMFDEKERVAVLSHKSDPIVEQVQNYLGGKEPPLIKHQRRKHYLALKLFVPEQLESNYSSFQGHPSIQLLTYNKIQQMTNQDPTLVIVTQQLQGKIQSTRCGQQTHIFVRVPYPSEKLHLFKNQRVVALSPTDQPLIEEVVHYLLGSQSPLLRDPPERYSSFTVVNYSSGNVQLDKLFRLMKTSYDQLNFIETTNLKLIQQPVLILCQERSQKTINDCLKQAKHHYLAVLSVNPSLFKQRFSLACNILAVSQTIQPIYNMIEQMLEPQKSIAAPVGAGVGRICLVLVGQNPAQVREWRKLSEENQRISISFFQSTRELQSVDFMASPCIVVVNENQKGTALLYLNAQGNSINQHLHLFVRAKRPSAYRKNMAAEPKLKAVSHEPFFLETLALKFMSQQPNILTLLRLQNRRQIKNLQIVVIRSRLLQNGIQQLEQLCRNQAVKIIELPALDQMCRVLQPTLVIAQAAQLRRVWNLSKMLQVCPLYFFLLAEYPADFRLAYTQLTRISLITNKLEQVVSELQHYLKKSKPQDLVKQLERRKFERPKVILTGFEDKDSQAESIRQGLSSAIPLLKINNIQRLHYEMKGYQVILIGRQTLAPQCYALAKQLQYKEDFRLMVLAQDVYSTRNQFAEIKRFVASCSSAEALTKELSHYVLTPERSFSLRVIKKQKNADSQKSRCSIQRRQSFLKRREGRLVWNMEENLSLVSTRLRGTRQSIYG